MRSNDKTLSIPAASVSVKTARKSKGKKAINRTPYLFVAPFLLVFIATIIIPVLMSLVFSFMEIGQEFKFVGIQNYIHLFDDPFFLKSYLNVFILMVGTIPVTVMLALFFAVLLNSPKVKAKGFFRTVYYIPTVTSMVAIATVFLTFYNPTGLFNTLLSMFNFDPVPWLTDPKWARVSLCISIIWMNTGYFTVLFLAGLQNISKEIYESASIDGASPVRQFFSITLPLVRPIMLLALILSTINGLNTFEIPSVLFGASYGPGGSTLMIGQYLYTTSFTNMDFGKASAVAWSMVLVAVFLSIIQFKVGGKDSE